MSRSPSTHTHEPASGHHRREGRRPAMLRTAMLVLLAEGPTHGYDLLARLAGLGLGAERGALYRTLRSMDAYAEVRSWWDSSSMGPDRRIYSLTAEGRRRLSDDLDELRGQEAMIAVLLDRSGLGASGGAAR